MAGSSTFKTRYLLGIFIREKLFWRLIRPGVSLKTLNLKQGPHSFNIIKLKYNDIKLLIID